MAAGSLAGHLIGSFVHIETDKTTKQWVNLTQAQQVSITNTNRNNQYYIHIQKHNKIVWSNKQTILIRKH